MFADVHNHMIYGVDDGAKDEAASVKLLEIAQNSGTGIICFNYGCAIF